MSDRTTITGGESQDPISALDAIQAQKAALEVAENNLMAGFQTKFEGDLTSAADAYRRVFDKYKRRLKVPDGVTFQVAGVGAPRGRKPGSKNAGAGAGASASGNQAPDQDQPSDSDSAQAQPEPAAVQ